MQEPGFLRFGDPRLQGAHPEKDGEEGWNVKEIGLRDTASERCGLEDLVSVGRWRHGPKLALNPTHRPLSISFWDYLVRILHINHKKELLIGAYGQTLNFSYFCWEACTAVSPRQPARAATSLQSCDRPQ